MSDKVIPFPAPEAKPSDHEVTTASPAADPVAAMIADAHAAPSPPKVERMLQPGDIWQNAARTEMLNARKAGGKGPWLTVAAICGNEAHHIRRFLDGMGRLADEIVLVRAIGDADPDETLTIAAECCTKPLVLAEYQNERGLNWKHVDNFARARQMSFNLAAGEFVMWADCDDIIEDDMLEKLRATVDLGNFDILFFSYRVIGSRPLMRERVCRRGMARWIHAVHEAMSIPGNAKPLYRPEIEIFHLPLGDGTGKSKSEASLSRNLRILEHSVGPATLAFFYLHRDSMLKPDLKKAIYWGKIAISCEDLTDAERYKVFVNIAQIFLGMGDFTQFETFAMNGMRANPDRRECYCLMAQSYVERKNFHRALLWIQMAKCLNPNMKGMQPNWLDESWYGWRADLLHSYILRRLDLPEKAREIEDHAHGGDPKISLLHATRGRADRALQARDQWFSMAFMPGQIEHIFAIDADDKATLAELEGFNRVVVEPGGGCVRAWNAAAAVARGRILVQCSDDWDFPYRWDNTIVWRMKEALEAHKPAVLAVSDGHRQDKLLCMAIITREQYLRQREERTGQPYLFHPDYKGVFSDNEFTVRAYENGVVIEAKDIVFNHDHPIFTGRPADETYRIQNSAERYAEGLTLFNKRNPRYKFTPPEPAAN